MRDAWYGHRDFYFEEYGDRNEWIDWDFALLSALQTIEDMTDNHGQLVWLTEPEAMDVSAKKKIDKFQAAIDKATKGTDKNPYKPEPGEVWVPDLQWRGSESDYPTYRTWLEEQRKKATGEAPSAAWGDSYFGKSWAEIQAEKEAAEKTVVTE